MQYSYQASGREYIVRLVDDIAEGVDEVEVEFVARVNGGRGRLPKTKSVLVVELKPLVDFEVAKKLSSSLK